MPTEHEGEHGADDVGDGLPITTITIRRYASADGDVIGCDVVGDGGLTMALGMLELAKATFVQQAMGEAP